ncbi:hypothetical protein WA158_008186 [Blastocystis sp. Blastoise]
MSSYSDYYNDDERYLLCEDKKHYIDSLPSTEKNLILKITYYQQHDSLGEKEKINKLIDELRKENTREAEKLKFQQELLENKEDELSPELKKSLMDKLNIKLTPPQKINISRVNNEETMNRNENNSITSLSKEVYQELFDSKLSIDTISECGINKFFKLLSEKEISEILLKKIHNSGIPGFLDALKKYKLKAKDFDISKYFYLLSLDELIELNSTSNNNEYSKNHDYVIQYMKCISSKYNLEDKDEYIPYYKELEEYISTLPYPTKYFEVSVYYSHLEYLEKHNEYDLDLLKYFLSIPKPENIYMKEVNKLSLISYFLPFSSSLKSQLKINNLESIDNYNCAPFCKNYYTSESLNVINRILCHFFLEVDKSIFSEYIEEKKLNELYETTLLLSGQSKIAPHLSKYTIEHLERTKKLCFENYNKEHFIYGEPIDIYCKVKNISSFTVQLFRINLLNYYKENHSTIIQSDIDLDGLIPQYTKIYINDKPSIVEYTQKLDLPNISERGVYIINIMGEQFASRALIYYGSIHILEQKTINGHIFHILDEKNNKFSSSLCSAILNEKEFNMSKDTNTLCIPYFPINTSDSTEILYFIIKQEENDYIYPYSFTHLSRKYELELHSYIDIESPMKGNNNMLCMNHIVCTMNNSCIYPLELLKDVEFTFLVTNQEDIISKINKKNIQLQNNKDYIQSLHCSDIYKNIEVQIQCTIGEGENRIILQSKSIAYSPSDSSIINNYNNKQNLLQCHYFRSIDKNNNNIIHNYLITDITGKEQSNLDVTIDIQTSVLKSSLQFSLVTNSDGYISIPTLPYMTSITITNNDLIYKNSIYTHPYSSICIDPICLDIDPIQFSLYNTYVPIPCTIEDLYYSYITLYSMDTNGNIAIDYTEYMSLTKDNYIVVSNLPQGNYILTIFSDYESPIKKTFNVKKVCKDIHLFDGYAITETGGLFKHKFIPVSCHLEEEKENCYIYSINGNKLKSLQIKIIAHTFDTDIYSLLDYCIPKNLSYTSCKWNIPESYYINGRKLPEEFMYIEERRKHKNPLPGNSLNHPGLLITPHKYQSTKNEDKQAKEGDAYESVAQKNMMSKKNYCASNPIINNNDKYSKKCNYQYYRTPSIIIPHVDINEKNNTFIINKSDLEIYKEIGCELSIILYDDESYYIDNTIIQCTEIRKDLTTNISFKEGFDCNKHYVIQNNISCLNTKEIKDHIEVTDITDITAMETINDVFNYLELISKNNNINIKEYSFLTNWYNLSQDKKQYYYKKYACHEFDFFIYKKDQLFFLNSILPLLQSKLEKDIVDKYLVGDDISNYIEISKYIKLNMFEKCLLFSYLLSHGHKQEEYTLLLENIKERSEESKMSMNQYLKLFDIAMKMKGLETPKQPEFIDKNDDNNDNNNEADSLEYEEEEEEEDLGGSSLFDGDTQITKFFSRSSRNSGFGSSMGSSSNNDNNTLYSSMYSAAPIAAPMPPIPPMMCCAAAPCDVSFASDSISPPMPNRPMLRGMPRMKMLNNRSFMSKAKCGDILSSTSTTTNNELENEEENIKEISMDNLYYKGIETTNEYHETFYIDQHTLISDPSLIDINPFWYDYILHIIKNPSIPFLSSNFYYCTKNITELLLCISLLDLPFELIHSYTYSKNISGSFVLNTSQPTILFYKQSSIQECSSHDTLTIYQKYIDTNDSSTIYNSQKVTKYMTENTFIIGNPYTCELIISNISPIQYDINIFYQLPNGSYPVLSTKYFQKTVNISVSPYSTKRIQYSFFFPSIGQFSHYPAHIIDTETQQLITYAQNNKNTNDIMNVIEKKEKIDKESWNDICLYGTNNDIISFIKSHNMNYYNQNILKDHLFDKDFYYNIIPLLLESHLNRDIILPYSFYHDDIKMIKEYLSLSSIYKEVNIWFISSLICRYPSKVDNFQIKEFKPLINSRKYKLGSLLSIQNKTIKEEYENILSLLIKKSDLNAYDYMILCYYLLLQDRIELSRDLFYNKVCLPKEEWKTECPEINIKDIISINEYNNSIPEIQFDYMSAYMDCFNIEFTYSRKIVLKYHNFPNDYWRQLFNELEDMIHLYDQPISIEKRIMMNNEDNNKQKIKIEEDNISTRKNYNDLSNNISLSISCENKNISIQSTNIDTIQLNIYKMDLEYLFSLRPFMSSISNQCSYILPNKTISIDINKEIMNIAIPEEYIQENIMIQAIGKGQTSTCCYYNNGFDVNLYRNNGYLILRHKETQKPIPCAYVKVYVKDKSDKISFLKDGYTDITGGFDYCSVSNNLLESTTKIAIYICTSSLGSTTKEVLPPSIAKSIN